MISTHESVMTTSRKSPRSKSSRWSDDNSKSERSRSSKGFCLRKSASWKSKANSCSSKFKGKSKSKGNVKRKFRKRKQSYNSQKSTTRSSKSNSLSEISSCAEWKKKQENKSRFEALNSLGISHEKFTEFIRTK